MNNKTKKIVAGVVLGTFVFGATTPAFATEQLYEDNIYLSDQFITNNNISEENVPGTETYGVAKHIVQAVKKVITDYWDKLPLPDKADFIRDKLLKALDFYFQYTDDVETAVRNAIYDVFPNANATVVNAAVAVIMELLPF